MVNRDAMVGFIIKSLQMEKLDDDLIENIVYNIQFLEEEITIQEAKNIYYDFFD